MGLHSIIMAGTGFGLPVQTPTPQPKHQHTQRVPEGEVSFEEARFGSLYEDFCWNPKYPALARTCQRLKTFKEWPEFLPTSTHELARAGFYYAGLGDQATCFYCGVIIKSWRPGDHPFTEHSKFSKNCGFLELTFSSPSPQPRRDTGFQFSSVH